jgi:peptidoglycan/LPS O-acetylase OafA/YrhL
VGVGKPGRLGAFFAAFTGLPQRMDSLLLGVVLALAYSSETGRELLRRNIGIVRMTTVVLRSGVCVLAVAWPDANCDVLIAGGGLSWIALTFAGIVVLALEPATILNRVTTSPILGWFGLRCYSLYLFHTTAMAVALAADGSPWRRGLGVGGRSLWCLGWLLTFLIAEVIYRAVETPALRLGWNANYRRPAETAAAVRG